MKEDKQKKEGKKGECFDRQRESNAVCARLSVYAFVKNGEFLFFNFVTEFLSFVCLFIFSIFVL